MAIKGERSAYPFGFCAGILGGAYNTNGPLIVMYGTLRQWSPETYRATLQGYFFFTGFLILLGHATAGLWTRTVFTYYLLALPVVLLGVWVGDKIHKTIAKGKFDRYIYMLLTLLGMFLFIQTLYPYLQD